MHLRENTIKAVPLISFAILVPCLAVSLLLNKGGSHKEKFKGYSILGMMFACTPQEQEAWFIYTFEYIRYL